MALHVRGGSITGIRELPCDLWNGGLGLGNELFEMIPIRRKNKRILQSHYANKRNAKWRNRTCEEPEEIAFTDGW
jgi:hypothetical protein